MGDPLRLRQVLVNLVDNAIKFTEKGEVVLRLEAGTPVADVLPLRISVRASRVGIPAAQRSMIFQHFTEADSSTTRKRGGKGRGGTPMGATTANAMQGDRVRCLAGGDGRRREQAGQT